MLLLSYFVFGLRGYYFSASAKEVGVGALDDPQPGVPRKHGLPTNK